MLNEAQEKILSNFAKQNKHWPKPELDAAMWRIKWAMLFITLGIYYGLPFVRWDRGPNAPDQAVMVDLVNGRFYFFFIELWPQEVYYFTGLLVIAAMTLFLTVTGPPSASRAPPAPQGFPTELPPNRICTWSSVASSMRRMSTLPSNVFRFQVNATKSRQ